MDDVDVFSKTMQRHIRQIRRVLTLLSNVGVTFKNQKIQFFTEAVKFYWSRNTSRTTQNRIPYDRRYTRISRTDQMHGTLIFLGVCNLLLRSVPIFVWLEALLNTKRQNDQTTMYGPLNEEELAAMNALKETLLFPSVLTLPKSTRHMSLNKNVCHKQIWCVLVLKEKDKTTQSIR